MTKIEWCHIPGYKPEVWNPVTGCTRVSPGCDHCYAIRQSHRFAGVPGSKFEGVTTFRQIPPDDENQVDWSGLVRCHVELLDLPLRWREPRAIFVNSMSDLFHDDVPEEFIAKVWYRMAVTDKHVYMILTKRPLKMKVILNSELFKLRFREANIDLPLKNVWLGVSCENQAMADQRIPHLLKTPAAVRFVSVEPMLGPVELKKQWMGMGTSGFGTDDDGVYRTKFDRLDWVICGGESGPGARPMHPDWPRALRDQCRAADVPFFFKQWGEYTERDWISDDPDPNGKLAFAYPDGTATAAWEPGPQNRGAIRLLRVGKKAAGDLLDGVQHHEWPEVVG